MTTVALLNEPRCLDLDGFAPRPAKALPDLGPAAQSGWAGVGSTGGISRFRHDAARQCLDTVAVLRAYREPLPGEAWRVPLGSERRLLAQVNALLALGSDALKQAAELAIDADLPDPGRVFASLFVLGCVAGPAWRQPMLSIFVHAIRRSPAEGAAAIEALSLSPNGDVLDGVSRLLDDERPAVRAAAVRVLSFRARLPHAAWTGAAEDDHGAVALAAASVPVAGLDRERCAPALERLLHHASEGVVRAALRAGLGLRLHLAHRRAREISRSEPGWADALQCLAMFGFRADEETVRAVLAGPQWMAGVRAAALSGWVTLVPDLLGMAPDVDATPVRRDETARALSTLTGLPFNGADDRAATASLWARHGDRFDPRYRYRHGRPFHPSVLLASLRLDEGADVDARLHLRDSRQQAYLELVAATDGCAPPFSAYDFVARQAASLQRIHGWLATASSDAQVAPDRLH